MTSCTAAFRRIGPIAGVLVTTLVGPASAQPALPNAISEPGGVPLMTTHAVGAQIYACVAGTTGQPSWQFREPIASLIRDGRTVGRHFAGPGWELADGSLVTGKVIGHVAGETAADIPWLKLEAAAGGRGQFAAVTVIQRINTKGGVLAGPCETVGELTAVPYAADYVFLGRPQ